MRLIDADAVYKILESCEIKKATIGNPLTDWEYGYNCGIERAESEIECAPTIDAIPIEWLEDFRDGLDTLSESQLMRAIDLIISAYRVEKKREEE